MGPGFHPPIGSSIVIVRTALVRVPALFATSVTTFTTSPTAKGPRTEFALGAFRMTGGGITQNARTWQSPNPESSLPRSPSLHPIRLQRLRIRDRRKKRRELIAPTVGGLDASRSDPPTVADYEALRAKRIERILALRRCNPAGNADPLSAVPKGLIEARWFGKSLSGRGISGILPKDGHADITAGGLTNNHCWTHQMTNKTQPRVILIYVLVGFLTGAVTCCQDKDLEELLDQLGKSERIRGSLGTFQVTDSPVTAEVISNAPLIVPNLLDLIERGENPQQLASAVYCLRRIGFWSAINRIHNLETRVEAMKKRTEFNESEAEPGPDGFIVNSFPLGVATLSYEIAAFRHAANQSQQNKAEHSTTVPSSK